MKTTFKTIVSVVLSYLVVISVLPLSVAAAGAAETTLQGSGTEAAPYRITTAAQFVYAINTYTADDAVYLSLENDVDVTGQYQPPSEFKAHLDGNFHTVTADNCFADKNSGAVFNLTYRNQKAYTSYSGTVGGFVRQNDGMLSGVITHADVKCQDGAVLCYNNNGSIFNCAALGSVDADDDYGANAGGVTFFNYGSVANCYAVVRLTVDDNGEEYSYSYQYPISKDSYKNCAYDKTNFEYSSYTGGYTTDEMKSEDVVAFLNTENRAEDSHWVLDTDNTNNGYPVLAPAYYATITSSKENILINGTESVSLSCTGGGQIYYTLDGSEPTQSSTRYTGPITISNTVTILARAYKNGMTGDPARFDYVKISGSGTASSPYLINSGAAFCAIAELPNTAHFKLTADIQLLKDFTTLFDTFSGELDGNNKTVSFIRSSDYQSGLFRENHGVIKNLHLDSSGQTYMTNGAFAYLNYGTITNCTFEGLAAAYVPDYASSHCYTVPNTQSNYGGSTTLYGAGGFVSVNYGTITDCAFRGDLTVKESSAIGGFVGINDATVINCLFEGDLQVNNLRFGPLVVNVVGGFMGHHSNNSCTDFCTANTQRIDVFTSNYHGGTTYTFGETGSNVTNCSNTYDYVDFRAYRLEWGSCSIVRQTLDGDGYQQDSQTVMGTVGDCTWRLVGSTLTIDGSGAIPDYSYDTYTNTPWYSYNNQIRTIIIGPNVTSVGSYSFRGMKVQKLIVNDTANAADLTIGEQAFAWSALTEIDFGRINNGRKITLNERCFDSCENLTSITLPKNVIFSDYYYNDAFHACKSLQSAFIYCPVVGGFAFESCYALSSLTLDGVTEIKKFAFRGNSLSEVTIPASVTIIEEYAFATSPYTGECKIGLIKAPNCSEGHAYALRENVPFEAIDTSAHTYQVSRWNWSADHTSATLTLVCTAHNDDTPTINAEVTVEDTPVTCTTDGSKVYTAAVTYAGVDYSDTYTDVTPSLGHDYIDHEAKDPTCTAIGWHAYQTCSRCDYTTYVEIPSLGHDYVEIDREDSTCEDEGTIYYRCSRCRKTSYEDIPALGHDFGEWTTTHEATCTEDGEKHRDCSRCGFTEKLVIEKFGHDYNSVVTPVTCTEGGYTTHTCSRCHYFYIDGEVEPLGHDYQVDVTKEPSVAKTGRMSVTCSRCDFEDFVSLPKLSEDNYTITNNTATCTEAGTATYTWKNTSYGICSFNAATDALGHDYVLVPIDSEYHHNVCSHCGDEQESQAHAFENGVCACGYTADGYVEDPALKGDFRSISLRSDLSINYYISDETLSQYTDPYLECRKAIYDEAGNITGYEEKVLRVDRSAEYEGKTYSGFTFPGVTAKEFSSVVSATFCGTKDGILHKGETTEYSVKAYAMEQLARTDDENLSKLLVDLLNYGAAAQTFFKSNLAHLANAELTTEQKTVATVTAEMINKPYDRDSTVPLSGVAFSQVTLSLRSEITLSLYFKSDSKLSFSCDKNKDVEKEKVTINGIEYQVARIRGITSKEIGSDFTLTFSDGENSGHVTYSPMTYCYNVLDRGTNEENLPEVVKALYWYWKSAETYFV